MEKHLFELEMVKWLYISARFGPFWARLGALQKLLSLMF